MDQVGVRYFSELERISGISSGTIIRRKNDYKFPPVEMAEGMCFALKVDGEELWVQASFVQELDRNNATLSIDQLDETEADIYYAIRDESKQFKRAVLKTIKVWLAHKEKKKE